MWTPRQATVDHHADAGDGQAGLGDIGRQHHPTTTVRVDRQGLILLLAPELAVQRPDDGVGRQVRLQLGQGASNLAATGQKHQQVAAGLA